MNSQPKILLSGLPPALAAAVEEQIAPATAAVTRQDDGGVFDLALCGPGAPAPGGAPVVRLAPGRARLGDVLRQIGQALAAPALYAEDVGLEQGWTFSARDRRLAREDAQIALTDRETEMIAYLARRRGTPATREDLLKDVWRYQADADTHTVETHIYRLRQKIEAASGPDLIASGDGGYALRRDPARDQRGSIYGYILIAIFLGAMLTVTLSSGPNKSALTAQVEETTTMVQADLARLAAAVEECVVINPAPADVDGNGTIDSADNPNPPFPLYVTAGVAGGKGGTGIDIDFRTNNIACPGVPGMPALLTAQKSAGLRALGNAAVYRVNYLSDATEGVLFRVTRQTASEIWTEAIARLNAKYSACKAAAVTSAGTCVNGCFYLWVSRRATSAIATSDDGVTCP